MENYGRKIIDYIFKRWTEHPAICYEPERKVQADSDRSDIRVFETGVSAQPHGNIGQSSRTAEEAECNRLIGIAKKHGLYIESRFADAVRGDGLPQIAPLARQMADFSQAESCMCGSQNGHAPKGRRVSLSMRRI